MFTVTYQIIKCGRTTAFNFISQVLVVGQEV